MRRARNRKPDYKTGNHVRVRHGSPYEPGTGIGTDTRLEDGTLETDNTHGAISG